MKNLIFLFCLVLWANLLFAQTTIPNCGFEPDAATIQWMNSHQEAIARFNADPARNRLRAVRRVPLRFVAFNSENSAALSQADVNRAVSMLNNTFAPLGIEFFSCQAPINIQSLTFANLLVSEETALLRDFEVQKVINVFCVESIENGAVSGYTYLPGLNTPEAIFMLKSHLSQSTFAHEMGHYYGLYHTHGKGNCGDFSDEFVSGADCDHTGDDVCDTPADPNLQGLRCSGSLVDSVSCAYIGAIRDGNGELYTPNVHNIMSYSQAMCRDHFSPGQYDRMRYFAQFRIYPEECPVAICKVPEIVRVDSTHNSLQIHWTAEDQDNSYQIRYRNVGDTAWQTINLSTNTWTWENLETCSRLEAQVRLACGAGFSGWSSLQQLKTEGCKDYYCTSYGGNSNIWINRLKLASWESISGNNQGYLLYRDLMLDLTSHKTYPLELELVGKIRPRDSLHWQIWIDKNLDGDFEDSGELIYQGKSAHKTLMREPMWRDSIGSKADERLRRLVHKGSFVLPSDLQSGVSRMRVVLSLNKFVDSPCDTSVAVLETEDYPVALRLSSACPAPASTNLLVKNITTRSAIIKAVGLQSTNYQWELSTYAGEIKARLSTNAVDSLYWIDFLENTRYLARVRILCKNGNYSEWSAPVSIITLPIPCPTPDSSSLSVDKITQNTAQFSLGVQKEAVFYHFFYREKGSSDWIPTYIFKSNVATIEQLKANTTYEFRAKIYCSDALATSSPYTVIKTFVTPPEPCRAPVPNLIQVQMLGDTVMRFSYKDINAYYSTYQWRYRLKGSSTWTTLEKGVSVVKNPDLGVGLEIAVQGGCSSGLLSEWSTIASFTTPCGTPKLNQLFVIDLRHNQAKIVYRGDKKNGFYWQYKRVDESDWSDETYVLDTLMRINNLEPSTIYQFRFRIYCTSLQWSAYSEAMTFKTLPIVCDLVQPDQLSFTYSSERKTLVHCEVPGVGYAWRYRLLGNENWIDSTETNTPEWLIAGLSFPADYEIQVKIQCAAGIWGDWSSIQFSTPNLNCLAPSAAQIQWQIGENSTHFLTLASNNYQELLWRYRKKGSTTWIILADSLARKGIMVADDEKWEVSVRGGCGEAGISAWSEPVELWGRCQTAPLSSLQIKKIEPQYLEIVCNVENTVRFYWEYRAQGDNYAQGAYTTQGNLILTDLKGATNYEIKVLRSCGEDHDSWFSESLHFTTPPLLCDPVDVGYIFVDRITGHSAVVSYARNDGTKQRVLAYRGRGENWTTLPPQEAREWQLGPLLLNASYEYRIGIYCELSGQLVWSNSNSFYTLSTNFCPTPEPELIDVLYETQTRLRFDYPNRKPEQLNWRYRETSDTAWTYVFATSTLTVEFDPRKSYQVSTQKICVDRLVSRWSDPRSYQALCQLDPKDLEINEKSPESLLAHCKMEGRRYEWAYRLRDQDEWQQRNWSASNQLSLDGLSPGTAYIIGLRVLCYQGDTTNWIEQTYHARCTAISLADILVEPLSFTSVRFSCLNDAYRQYQWRLRSKTRVEEWYYVDENSPAISYLYDASYEVQVRGLCLEDDKWSEWSASKLFTLAPCRFPDAVKFELILQPNKRYHLVALSSSELWHADQYKWQYRVFGQKEWIELGYTDQNYLDMPTLLPGTRYEVALEMNCGLGSDKKTYFGEVVTLEDCFVPSLSNIEVQKITQQSAEVNLKLNHPVQYEVRYRVKGSRDAYRSAAVNYLTPIPLSQLSPGTEYEVMLRIICEKGAPWTEAFYFRTKTCDIPYDGRIILSSIGENEIKAYVEISDFNPVVTGVNYTWYYKAARSNIWMKIPEQTSNTLALQSLVPQELYDLQVTLQCKNNPQDTIVFTTHFRAATSACSASPDLAWLHWVFEGPNKGFHITCNLPFEYSVSIRSWITDRQQVIQGNVVYLYPQLCSHGEFVSSFDEKLLYHFQFRLICPDGNIGPWSEVITLDQLQGVQKIDPALLIPRTSTPATSPTLKLWPNPSAGQFQVQVPGGLEGESLLSVFSADGRKVMTQKIQAPDQMPVELDLSGQAAGLYLIKVQAGKKMFTERVLLQKP